jgi:DNA polymerase IV
MVGDQTYSKLRSLGVEKIRTVQEMPMDLMETVLGQNGLVIWKKANGIDPTPVVPFHERKSISSEQTFEKDTTDVEKLRSIVIAMAENLAYQLRNEEKVTACVSVKIRYSDFQTHTKQKRIPYTSLDQTLISTVLELFESVYNRRILIRLIGVKFSNLVSGSYQIKLFDDSQKLVNLYQALDKIRNRYGQDAVKRAIGMEMKRIGHMNPFNGQMPMISQPDRLKIISSNQLPILNNRYHN